MLLLSHHRLSIAAAAADAPPGPGTQREMKPSGAPAETQFSSNLSCRKIDANRIVDMFAKLGQRVVVGGSDGAMLHAALLLPAVTLVDAVPRHISRRSSFRYWVDYQALSSPESAALAERALTALGGVRTGGPLKVSVSSASPLIRDYGYMHMGAWDLLLSITAKAMLAAELLRPGQLVAVVPGLLCVSRKTSLLRTLVNAYGQEAAFTLMPRSFKLPDELDDWAAWVGAHPQQDTGLWMLKNNKQRGTGLRLVSTSDAFHACFETTTRPGLEGMRLYRWYLAQQYVAAPLLIQGRKFGLRLWALVPGTAPLRAYLHQRGLVLFSSEPYPGGTPDGIAGNTDGLPPGHITNYAQNENGEVWELSRLARHMGVTAWQRLWAQLARATALVFAAALRRVQEVQSQMDLPPRSTFQCFGLDFLIDAEMHPWLMEVNATPSMKVAHSRGETADLIHDQKWPVVWDTFNMLGVGAERFRQAAELGAAGAGGTDSLADVGGELARCGGYLPLMHLFPGLGHEGAGGGRSSADAGIATASGGGGDGGAASSNSSWAPVADDARLPGLSIPWTAADRQLRRWLVGSDEYWHAAAGVL